MPEDAAHQQIQNHSFHVIGSANRQIESPPRKGVALRIRPCLLSPNNS